MRQITIVTESRRGLTADIAELLAAADINIETLDAEEVEGADVVTLSVDHYNRRLAVLRDAGYPAVTEDALLVRVEDEPGALAKVDALLEAAGLSRDDICFAQVLLDDIDDFQAMNEVYADWIGASEIPPARAAFAVAALPAGAKIEVVVQAIDANSC